MYNTYNELRVVTCFKHLGTNTSPVATNCSEEIHIRSAIMSQQNKTLSKVFSLSKVSYEEKAQAGYAYIVSKGALHASTWPSLSSHQFKVFSKPVYIIVQLIYAYHNKDKINL